MGTITWSYANDVEGKVSTVSLDIMIPSRKKIYVKTRATTLPIKLSDSEEGVSQVTKLYGHYKTENTCF